MNLSMFTPMEKIKYAIGKFIRLERIRSFLDYEKLFERRSLYHEYRDYSPRYISEEITVFSYNHPKLGVFKSYIRMKSSDAKVYKQVIRFDKILEEKLPENANIIDAGANIGLTSIGLSLLNPDSRIIAIEPDKDNYELLKKNLVLNNCKNVTPLNFALWTHSEILNFGNGFRDNQNWSFSIVNNDKATNVVNVQGHSIDYILDQEKINFIDFLKVDIEGAEKDLFLDNDFLETLKIKCKKIVTEVHEEQIKVKEVNEILKNIGFDTFLDNEHIHGINKSLKNVII